MTVHSRADEGAGAGRHAVSAGRCGPARRRPLPGSRLLPFVAPVGHSGRGEFAERWRTRGSDLEFQEVQRAAHRIDAEYRTSTPWWGRCDLDEAHAFRAAGRPVLIDVFCMRGRNCTARSRSRTSPGCTTGFRASGCATHWTSPISPGEQYRRDPCPPKGLGTRSRMTACGPCKKPAQPKSRRPMGREDCSRADHPVMRNTEGTEPRVPADQNGGDARTVGSNDGHRVSADYGRASAGTGADEFRAGEPGVGIARGRRPRAALRAGDSAAAPVRRA